MTGQTVYVLHWIDYDYVGVAGVYTTHEQAKAAEEDCKLNNPHLPYHIEPFTLDGPAERPRPHWTTLPTPEANT